MQMHACQWEVQGWTMSILSMTCVAMYSIFNELWWDEQCFLDLLAAQIF